MNHELLLRKNAVKRGSYYRKELLGDVLYNSFIYQDIHITFAKKDRKTSIEDDTVSFLKNRNIISDEAVSAYKEKIASCFTMDSIRDFDSGSIEELYQFISKLREEQLGKKVLETAWRLRAEESVPLIFKCCLDQREKIDSICAKKEHVILALTDPRLFSTMTEIITDLSAIDKKIWLLVSDNQEEGLPAAGTIKSLLKNSDKLRFLSLEKGRIFCDAQLSDAVRDENAFLMIFGETGLLGARGLSVPCGVFAELRGFYTCAVCGQLGLIRPVAVYIPQGYDITKTVPVTEKTRLSYLDLAKLEKAFGEEVYSLAPEELYARFPKYFFNIYENSPEDLSSDSFSFFDLPKGLSRISFSDFNTFRDDAIQKHLEGFTGCNYYAGTFSEKDIDGIEGNILVHGIRVKGCHDARVIQCGKDAPLRAKIRTENKGETAIVSNFLFFLTPKLATLYNELRYDCKEEMAEVDAGHLDYLLEYRDGKRFESFPLFRKTCIAMKNSGEFLFFNFRLGGGRVFLNDLPVSWEKEDVDPSQDSPLPRVCIYTPYSSLSDGDADRESYRKAVGEGRVNFVIIQNRITAIRNGNVILPGMGVVLSLEKSLGDSICKKLKLRAIEHGYFEPSSVFLDVKLDAPEGISENDWCDIKWAYGGGLSLILDGVGLCDGDHMEDWFEKDGWTSPLSRQTQESNLHSLVKNPRTAVGTTDKNELVILVFSGRTKESVGADYKEMILIARKLFPDIRNLMNVDGGGSAVLGMVQNGSFTELSLPSTSTDSTVGMVRPINTALYIPLTK